MLGTGEDRYCAGHFTTTLSELLAAHWLADRFPERFEAHSRTVVQDRADVPRSTHYNRRHFHVWPSSLEMTTLLPPHSQIVPSPVTSKAT